MMMVVCDLAQVVCLVIAAEVKSRIQAFDELDKIHTTRHPAALENIAAKTEGDLVLTWHRFSTKIAQTQVT
eukprot:3239207-Amphidinium_carterae.1